MGCASSSTRVDEPVDSAGNAASLAIQEELEKEQKEENKIIKLLVLGTGESGKSTVFKQMKILYSVPDPPSKFVNVVRANLFGNAVSVKNGMDKLGIEFSTPEGKSACEEIDSMPADGAIADFTSELPKLFEQMKADSGVQEAIDRASEFQLNDSTEYFWERAPDILRQDYEPTQQDVLRARVRTTGIVQQNFQIGSQKYTMFDVGGQRNERRKWIHCFDNVTAVIFVTAISEFDQVLYEDENTNRMDEALVLFEQICNHPSFQKTSMILFLNKRDLFMEKLKKKDLSVWDPTYTGGKDYDLAVNFIKEKFLERNKAKDKRQVYVHATCATDTENISFVTTSVFSIILKENLRKMGAADINSLLGDGGGGEGNQSGVRDSADIYSQTEAGRVLLVSCSFVDTLKERKVLVEAADTSRLPAVEMQTGKLDAGSADWKWVLGLGKSLPLLEVAKAEIGSFKGNFKQASRLLRGKLGLSDDSDLGFVYDEPIYMPASNLTLVICVRTLPKITTLAPTFKWVQHEEFEDACYAAYMGIKTKNAPPAKGREFDPFAPNPVGHRWFKGITLYTAQVEKVPRQGVYLGIFKVCSTTDGFKVMVNQHNRIMIPLIFLTESQLGDAEKEWMHGVRVRGERGIDILEGKKPNGGWLGPEMSGEEGATFPEKLHWAVDEAKARLGTRDLGSFYDTEILDVDENNNIQLILYASLARDEADILPGHVWMDREMLEVQNMKYMCPTTLQSLLNAMHGKLNEYMSIDTSESLSYDENQRRRTKRDDLKAEVTQLVVEQAPLKWVNRVIEWCAAKMPSFADAIDGAKDKDVGALVKAAIEANTEAAENRTKRAELLTKYKK